MGQEGEGRGGEEGEDYMRDPFVYVPSPYVCMRDPLALGPNLK